MAVTFTTHDTCRERCRRLLATTDQPLTVAAIAEQLDTTPTQAARALRQLEAQSAAVRERGRPWASPDQWTASR